MFDPVKERILADAREKWKSGQISYQQLEDTYKLNFIGKKV